MIPDIKSLNLKYIPFQRVGKALHKLQRYFDRWWSKIRAFAKELAEPRTLYNRVFNSSSEETELSKRIYDICVSSGIIQPKKPEKQTLYEDYARIQQSKKEDAKSWEFLGRIMPIANLIHDLPVPIESLKKELQEEHSLLGVTLIFLKRGGWLSQELYTELLRFALDPIKKVPKDNLRELVKAHPIRDELNGSSSDSENTFIDHLGRTLLHVAIERKDTLLIQALLKLGADPYQPDLRGKRPIDFADDLSEYDLEELSLQKVVNARNCGNYFGDTFIGGKLILHYGLAGGTSVEALSFFNLLGFNSPQLAA